MSGRYLKSAHQLIATNLGSTLMTAICPCIMSSVVIFTVMIKMKIVFNSIMCFHASFYPSTLLDYSDYSSICDCFVCVRLLLSQVHTCNWLVTGGQPYITYLAMIGSYQPACRTRWPRCCVVWPSIGSLGPLLWWWH